MEEQQALFPQAPAPERAREEWVCSKCGNDNQRKVRPDESRPSLDPRYVLGFCDDCTPTKRTVRGPARENVQLVHRAGWDRQAWVALQVHDAENRLLTRYRLGHALTKDEHEQVRAIVVRLGGGT